MIWLIFVSQGTKYPTRKGNSPLLYVQHGKCALVFDRVLQVKLQQRLLFPQHAHREVDLMASTQNAVK